MVSTLGNSPGTLDSICDQNTEFPREASALERLEVTPHGYRMRGYAGLVIEINQSAMLTLAQHERARMAQRQVFSWRCVQTEREAAREIVSFACLKTYSVG